MYVDLALPLPIKKLFTYKVPQSLNGSIALGQKALVELGSRYLVGVVVGLNVVAPQLEVKNILSPVEEKPLFSKNLLGLTKWISEYYSSSWGECLKIASPQYPNISERIWVEVTSSDGEVKDLSLKRRRLWEEIKNRKKIKVIRLSKKLGIKDIHQHLQHLEQRGLIKLKAKLPKVAEKALNMSLAAEVKTDSVRFESFNLDSNQQKIADSISKNMEKKTFSTCLLFAENRARRREIQLELTRRAISSKRQVLVLLPETSLIDELLSDWQGKVGQEIAVVHSGIPINRRIDTWNQIKDKRFSLVMGTRLAVFAPLDDLGLIIVEEEAHTFHKEEASPYYNARDVAVVRGKMEKAVVVLSSDVPSLESFYNCQKGKYKLCQLKEDNERKAIPKIEVIDKRRKGGAKEVISPIILDILRKETRPAVLLLNRRGFSRSVVCDDCGFAFRCPDCGIGLVFHKTDLLLRCHYCNYQSKGAKVCPGCGGTDFSYRGFGTQNLEQALKRNIPELKSIRLDSDVISKSKGAGEILSQFHQGKYQILLGTQMVLRGLDLSKVGLVIILSIDELLTYPDFRARETGFHFLSQIINKVRETSSSAKLIIQTSWPEDKVIRYAVKGDFLSFYRREVKERRELFYPPFSHLISLSFSGRSQQSVTKFSNSLVDSLNILTHQRKVGKTQVLGPVPVSYARRRKQNEWQAIVKTTSPIKIGNLFDSILEKKELRINKLVRFRVEVDPLSLI